MGAASKGLGISQMGFSDRRQPALALTYLTFDPGSSPTPETISVRPPPIIFHPLLLLSVKARGRSHLNLPCLCTCPCAEVCHLQSRFFTQQHSVTYPLEYSTSFCTVSCPLRARLYYRTPLDMIGTFGMKWKALGTT